MNINQPLLHPVDPWPRRAVNAVKDFEPHKVAHLGIAILIGSLSLATTIQSAIVSRGNDSWSTTCTAEECVNLQLHTIINVISSIALALLVVGHLKVAISSMATTKKIAKIAVPVVLGCGIATTISLQMPQKCTKITDFSPPQFDIGSCLMTVFSAEFGSTFFPHCIISPEFKHDYYRRGGFCINTTIDQKDFDSWEQWVYTSPWPGIERTNYKPGYCGMLELETPSVITNWSGMPSLEVEALEYWKRQNSNYSLPVSIQSSKTVLANNSDGGWDSIGNWLGTIHSTGWIMQYITYPEVCVVPYAELPQFVLDCSSEAFRLNYTTRFDPGIIQQQAIVAAFDRDVKLCKPWIRYILFTNPILLSIGCISSIVLCSQSRRRVQPLIQHGPPPQQQFIVHLNDPLVEEDPPEARQPEASEYACV